MRCGKGSLMQTLGPNGEGRVERQAAVQHDCLPETGAGAGGDSFVACGGGDEGGDDLDLASEVVMCDIEGDRDPHLCREWNAATLEPMPQPCPHSSSDRITRLIGCSGHGDSCSLLAKSLLQLEGACSNKLRCTDTASLGPGVKRGAEDVEWLHNATSSAAR
jgi:hypothetical protein